MLPELVSLTAMNPDGSVVSAARGIEKTGSYQDPRVVQPTRAAQLTEELA